MEVLPAHEIYIKEEPQEDLKIKVEVEDDRCSSVERPNVGDQLTQERVLCVESDGHEFALGHAHEGEETEQGEDLSSDEESGKLDILECPMCSKRYSTAASLRAHLSKKHRVALGPCYTCHLCGAIGQSKATLKRHLLRTHGEQSIMRPELLRKCRHCGEGLTSQAALYNHISLAHAEELDQYHRCPVCPALVRSRPSLRRHFSRSHPGVKPPGQESERCTECNAGFRSRTALRVHLKANHPESLLHKCKICTSTFKYSYLLSRHIKAAHEDKLFPTPKRRYKCAECGREYRVKTRLEKHINHVHTNPEKRVYRCTLCDVTFPSNNHRVRHYRSVHRDRKRPHCSECTKCFDTIEELNIHRQEHKMNCAVCDKTFLRRDSLREHLLIHNGPRLPCPYCSKTFTQNSNLKRHIRIHTGEKPYKCTFCSKRFGDKSACNSHIRVHTGAERCKCHLCGASFSKRQKLNYHMRKHTGEGLLHCPLCTKPTTNSYALKKHIETHQQALVHVLLSMGMASHVEDCPQLALRALHNLACTTVQNSDHHRLRKAECVEAGKNGENELKVVDALNCDHSRNKDETRICEISKNCENTRCELTNVDINSPKSHVSLAQTKEFPRLRTSRGKKGRDKHQCCNNVSEGIDLVHKSAVEKNNDHQKEKLKEENMEGILNEENILCSTMNLEYCDVKCEVDSFELGNKYRDTEETDDCASGVFQKEYAKSSRKSRNNKMTAENKFKVENCVEHDQHVEFRKSEGLKRHCGNHEESPVKKQNRGDSAEGSGNLSEATKLLGGIQEEPVVVLTRLLQHIMESHCQQMEVTATKPTLGDQLVEQCLQVIMNDDVSGEGVPEWDHGNVGLDLRVHRNSHIEDSGRLSDKDCYSSVDVKYGKSTDDDCLSPKSDLILCRNNCVTADKKCVDGKKIGDMNLLISEKSGTCSDTSGTVILVNKCEIDVSDPKKVCGKSRTETVISDPSVTLENETDVAKTSRLKLGFSSKSCVDSDSLSDVSESSEFQPINYSCESNRVVISPESLASNKSEDFHNQISCVDSSDLCLDLSLTGTRKGYRSMLTCSSASYSDEQNAIHRKQSKGCCLKEPLSHDQGSHHNKDPEVHLGNSRLKLYGISKMNLTKTCKIGACSCNRDEKCSSCINRKRKDRNILTASETSGRCQKGISDECEQRSAKVPSSKGNLKGENCEEYAGNINVKGKHFSEHSNSRGFERRVELESVDVNDFYEKDETTVMSAAQEGITHHSSQKTDGSDQCQDVEKQCVKEDGFVKISLSGVYGKAAKLQTVKSDEGAPTDLCKNLNSSKGVIRSLDKKHLSSVKVKEMSHFWRVSQSVPPRPVCPFVEKSTKCFSSPSVSVSYKSYVPANGRTEERTCD